MMCEFCGHDIGEHEPLGEDADGMEILECTARGCRCEVREDQA